MRSNTSPASCIRSRARGPMPSESTSTRRGPFGARARPPEQALAGGVHAVLPAVLGEPGLQQPSRAPGRSSRHRFRGSTLPCSRTVRRTRACETPASAITWATVVRLVAVARDRLDHRAVEAAALVAFHLVPGHPAGAVRQPAVHRRELLPRTSHPHSSNVMDLTAPANSLNPLGGVQRTHSFQYFHSCLRRSRSVRQTMRCGLRRRPARREDPLAETRAGRR